MKYYWNMIRYTLSTENKKLFDTGKLVANPHACDKFIRIIRTPTTLVFKVMIFGLSDCVRYN